MMMMMTMMMMIIMMMMMMMIPTATTTTTMTARDGEGRGRGALSWSHLWGPWSLEGKLKPETHCFESKAIGELVHRSWAMCLWVMGVWGWGALWAMGYGHRPLGIGGGTCEGYADMPKWAGTACELHRILDRIHFGSYIVT